MSQRSDEAECIPRDHMLDTIRWDDCLRFDVLIKLHVDSRNEGLGIQSIFKSSKLTLVLVHLGLDLNIHYNKLLYRYGSKKGADSHLIY